MAFIYVTFILDMFILETYVAAHYLQLQQVANIEIGSEALHHRLN